MSQTPDTQIKKTGAAALVDALTSESIRYLFGNFGSDHAGIIQAIGEAKQDGLAAPEVVLCPHESVAASAAHGYAQATGNAQAVFVHCDVGTANLGGSLHNAARCQVPMFVFAGATPFTLHGELPGTRNREANYSQDVFDQASIVRPYVKWAYELRTAKNVHQVVRRALDISRSEPAGPVYMTAAREVLEEDAGEQRRYTLSPVEPVGLTADQLAHVLNTLAGAERPLIVTTYAGRQANAVGELVRLAEQTQIPVLEARATDMNFPNNHPLRLGAADAGAVEQADVILALDCDLPWLPLKTGKITATTLIIDKDPIKERLPLWEIPASGYYRGDSLSVLRQMNALVSRHPTDRKSAWYTHSQAELGGYSQKQNCPLTADMVFQSLNRAMSADTILVDEAVTNSSALRKYVLRTRPGTFYSNGGTSLGWSLGASIGIKLANPDKTVVAVVGDGAYLLGTPAAAYWTAAHANSPFLTLIMNNRGWNATKQNMLRLYPDSEVGENVGYLSRLTSDADLGGVAAAMAGAFTHTVTTMDELEDALPNAMQAVRGGRCAVLDLRLETI